MDPHLSFEDFCNKKKIDTEKFKKAEPEYYNELKSLFEQIHPDSFNMQKLFIINNIRRKYHLEEPTKNTKNQEETSEKSSKTTENKNKSASAKPKVKPKVPPKKNKGE